MAEQQMIELLNGMGAKETATRTQATKMYADARKSNPDQLVMTLMKVAAVQGAKDEDKKSACVYLRQLLNQHGSSDNFVFANLQPATKEGVAQGLLELFEKEASETVQSKLADVIDALAGYVCNSDMPQQWLVQGQSCGWPTLLPACVRMAAGSSVTSSKNAFKLLKELIPYMKDEFVRQTAQIGQLLQGALQSATLPVKTTAVLLVLGMVETLDKKDWVPLTGTLPVIVSVCTELAGASQTQDLQDILEAFVQVTSVEADFFKNAMTTSFQPATLLGQIIKSKEADEDLRMISLEWITSYAEQKPKFLLKSVPQFAPNALECCMAMMLEIEDGEAELKEWAGRMDDEEGEEDADKLYSSGEESMDRMAEALGMEGLAAHLFPLIAKFTMQGAWQAKHAGLATVKQICEYVEEETHMSEMAKLLMANVDNPHPRVRYTSLHAIGQLANDQAPQFQEQFHSQVMPLLMRCCDDPVDRVAAMAMSAFVSFAEELKDVLAVYSQGFMEKFLGKLQSSNHRGIQEEAITAIAVIAAVVRQDFAQYYSTTMPLLKQLISSATGEKQQRLRGKAFECLSLLGEAVSKEQFLPDAKQALETMLTTQSAVDDLQREYINEAMQRIARCLKKDFSPFLPAVLPRVLKTLDLEDGGGLIQSATSGADDDDAIEMNVNGKLVKVKSTKFEEMHEAVRLLNTFIKELEEGYYDFIQPTAQVLLPILQRTDEVSMYLEDARGDAFQTWSLLVKASAAGGKAKNIPAPYPLVAELLNTIVTTCVELLKKAEQEQGEEVDPEVLGYYAYGMEQSLKEAGPGYISPAQTQQYLDLMFQLMDQSTKRSEKLKALMKKSQGDYQPDEDDEDRDPLEDETVLRRGYEAVLGGLMKANPEAFSQLLQPCNQKMQVWLASKDEKVLALHFACDMIEYLKEKSCSLWPSVMPAIFACLTDKDPQARIAASYAVNLASAVADFATAAPEAFNKVATIVGGKAAKKRDEQAKCAMDNAVAALFALAKNMGPQCPANIDAFGMALAKLPLRSDLEEALKVHKLLVERFLAEDAGLIGANQKNMGKILSVFAELHKEEDISNPEIDDLVTKVFKALPMAMIQQHAAAFSEKQQKRIEKILTSP